LIVPKRRGTSVLNILTPQRPQEPEEEAAHPSAERGTEVESTLAVPLQCGGDYYRVEDEKHRV